ncbi:MAG: dihydrofolate reductase [Caulobacterales bacterium]
MTFAAAQNAKPRNAKVTLVVARAKNGVIGADGAIPWRLSSDLRQFKTYTMGKPVLMGRKTWDSFPKKPLTGRPNLILTRDHAFRAEGALVYSDIAVMLAAARAMTDDEICVIGGGQLYDLAFALADRVRLTEVDVSPKGDVFFAEPGVGWREVSRETFEAGPKDDAGFTVRVFERA